MKKVQLNRLKEQLEEVLKESFTFSAVWDNEKQLITEAKFNTKEHLTKLHLKQLDYIADSWNFQDYSVKRSGTGLTYVFLDAVPIPAEV
jgi:3-hydroxyisobutyrate dehydrogenase-like beta-hydroxyacid dehydrogenase